MGTLFSCFARPRTRSTSSLKYPPKHLNPTPISHPYPLAARQRAMSEYHRPFTPTPPAGLSPTATHSPIRKHHAPSTTTSRYSSPSQRAIPRGPMRVHEIPFPLLLSSSAPSSPYILSPSSSLRPLATTPRDQKNEGSTTSGSVRRKLKKVQVVDGGWELWRENDWGGYGYSLIDRAGGVAVVDINAEVGRRGYRDGEMIPLSPRVDTNSDQESGMNREGMRDLSGCTAVAVDEVTREGTT